MSGVLDHSRPTEGQSWSKNEIESELLIGRNETSESNQ